jgi:ribosomal protein S18 acetylase RimI-like enzyme
MYDLFVIPEARGKGVGRALIEKALEVARESGAAALEWTTAPDNETAQRLYDSIPGAEKSPWLEYEIEI